MDAGDEGRAVGVHDVEKRDGEVHGYEVRDVCEKVVEFIHKHTTRGPFPLQPKKKKGEV